uniref:Uncharacterized protein n=1 Tax=Sphaerodactylus townsendi TaxID=933632 RepID=A0ACB8FFS9_9SAUR
MCKNDNVSWHMIGLGSVANMHGVHFQGNTIHLGGRIRDTLALFPHTSMTALMQPDRAGTFQVVCTTFDHFTGGMKHLYEVEACNKAAEDRRWYGTIRTHYIAAEEVEWDYAPNKSWAEKKENSMSKEESYGHVFVSQGEDRIGSKYKKVVYRAYKSGDFLEHKKRTAREQHLQILGVFPSSRELASSAKRSTLMGWGGQIPSFDASLFLKSKVADCNSDFLPGGPLIRAEVGDTILILFKNKASRPYSVTAHGIEDTTNGEEAHVTMPGEISIYQWNVPERSGPGISDPNCITWVYYSTANVVKDMSSGLIGPLIICRKGVLNAEGLRKDIDREFVLLFTVFDENESWYLKGNVEKYLRKNPKEFNHTADFVEGNKMHAINGKIFYNLPGLIMKEGENTNWYLIGIGNEIDIHTAHFHGESFLLKFSLQAVIDKAIY